MPKGTIYEHIEPTETELAWISGLWEGEGTWTFKKGRTRTYPNGKTYTGSDYIRMTIQMTDEDIVSRIAAIMDGRKVTYSDGGKVHKAQGQKPTYILNLQGAAAKHWTEKMIPYLGERRKQKYYDILQKLNDKNL